MGEEDLACEINESDAAGGQVCASDLVMSSEEREEDGDLSMMETLEKELRDLLAQNNNDNSIQVPIQNVTIFVYPLDGTREFVEGRVYNVQSLVGIAVNGYSMAGAIGLPFAVDDANDENNNQQITIIGTISSHLGRLLNTQNLRYYYHYSICFWIYNSSFCC